MQIKGTRFGDIEINDAQVLEIPAGMIGFPEARKYVLLERSEGAAASWLQSIDEPGLAFPVLDGAAFGPSYPATDIASAARQNGFEGNDFAVLVVIVPRPRGTAAYANLLAPVVVDMNARRGAQLVLDPRRYSAQTPLAA